MKKYPIEIRVTKEWLDNLGATYYTNDIIKIQDSDNSGNVFFYKIIGHYGLSFHLTPISIESMEVSKEVH